MRDEGTQGGSGIRYRGIPEFGSFDGNIRAALIPGTSVLGHTFYLKGCALPEFALAGSAE
jgi:hypothetical protein